MIDGLDGPPALLEVTYVTNPGAAWRSIFGLSGSLDSSLPWPVALFSIFSSSGSLSRTFPNLLKYIFGGICGGIALRNLGDRLFREPAAVVDFIDVFLPFD